MVSRRRRAARRRHRRAAGRRSRDRILRTGDWNPHLFDYPTLVIYFHAVVAIVRFLWGALQGEWSSLDGFTDRRRSTRPGRFAAALHRRRDGVAHLPARHRAGVAPASALLAAAQLAVRPLHVRESHFILTDVPMTALTTLALWLSVRARAPRDRRAPTRGPAPPAAWRPRRNTTAASSLVARWPPGWSTSARAPQRCAEARRDRRRGRGWRSCSAAPYTLLDMPAFLDGFAAQFARFAAPAAAGEPALAPVSQAPVARRRRGYSVPLALAGVVAAARPRRDARGGGRPSSPSRWPTSTCWRRTRTSSAATRCRCCRSCCVLHRGRRRSRWSTASQRFAAAQAAVAAAAAGRRRVVLLCGRRRRETVRWLDQLKRADTRSLATDG